MHRDIGTACRCQGLARRPKRFVLIVRDDMQMWQQRRIAAHCEVLVHHGGFWLPPLRHVSLGQGFNPQERGAFQKVFVGGLWSRRRRRLFHAGQSDDEMCRACMGTDSDGHRLWNLLRTLSGARVFPCLMGFSGRGCCSMFLSCKNLRTTLRRRLLGRFGFLMEG